MNRSTRRAVWIVGASLAVVLASCGGGDDTDTDTAEPAAAEASEAAEASQVAESAEPADVEPATAPNSDAPEGCAAAEQVSAAAGIEMQFELVEPAEGLIFCHYSEVGATDPVMVWITLNEFNPVQPADGLVEVPGLGQQALWSGIELTAWSGDFGLSLFFPGKLPDGDLQQVAVAIAEVFI